MALLGRPSLQFPAGRAPGFDLYHPASQSCILSVVALGRNMVDVLSGRKGSIAGAPSFLMHGSIGPSMVITGSSDNSQFAVPGFSTYPLTMAAIFQFSDATASNKAILELEANTPPLFFIRTASFNPAYTNIGNGNTTSAISLAPNTAYFGALSADASNVDFVFTNLATGAVLVDTQSNASGSTGTGNLFANIAQDTSFGFPLGGSCAAGMFAYVRTPKSALTKWGFDPWAFWYPQQSRNRVGVAAVLRTGWMRGIEYPVVPRKLDPDNQPAIALTPATLPPKIAGMSWFQRWANDPITRPTISEPVAPGGRAPTVPISGMAWQEPPDRDVPAIKVRIESPPAIALNPSTLPPRIAGMAWFTPPDNLAKPLDKYHGPTGWDPQVVATGGIVAPPNGWMVIPQETLRRLLPEDLHHTITGPLFVPPSGWQRSDEFVPRKIRNAIGDAPAISLTPSTLPPKISGMAWYHTLVDVSPAKYRIVDYQPALIIIPSPFVPSTFSRSQYIVALDDSLRAYGQDVILRRAGAPLQDVTVRVVIRAFRPEELIGGITQNDALVILSPTQIRQASWPGVVDAGVSPFNPPVWMPRRNDKIISLGRMYNVDYVKPLVVNDEVVRIELTVKG